MVFLEPRVIVIIFVIMLHNEWDNFIFIIVTLMRGRGVKSEVLYIPLSV